MNETILQLPGGRPKDGCSRDFANEKKNSTRNRHDLIYDSESKSLFEVIVQLLSSLILEWGESEKDDG